MFLAIKNRIEAELKNYISAIDKAYSLSRISPLLFRSIKDFISRKGKRIRPTLFVAGFLGFAGKAPPGLFRSAVSLEIFHDFMLVHDDIIDKSGLRRGKPSMHALLNKRLKNSNIKFSGEDLAIVAGDVMYAMAIEAFLSVKADLSRKEAALRKLIQAGIYTGSGEFIELLLGMKGIEKITKADIYKIYDLKTADYTFAAPLSMGAILAGAGRREIKRLFNYGMFLGRAFQIKDDIIGLFSDEMETGKSNLTDLKEAKKTILVWYAFQKSGKKGRESIKNILTKDIVGKKDLLLMRQTVSSSGALNLAREEVRAFSKKADALIKRSSMRPEYKEALSDYSKDILL